MGVIIYLTKKSKSFIWTVALVIDIIVGVNDYLVGYEVGMSLFYLLPICLTSGFVSKKAGITMSIISIITMIFADFLGGKPLFNYRELWDIFIPLGFFIIIAQLIHTLTCFLTERGRMEQLLTDQLAKLEAANNELESFSYSVSHDLRAPLRAIDGYSRMILRKHAGNFDEEARAKFNVIRESTHMMGQLIDDLLAFSRLGRAELSTTTVDIRGMIGEIWEEIKAANPDRHLTLKIAEIPPCKGDQVLIKQVLVNLLSNAVKFTRGRAEARIEAGGDNKEGKTIYYIRDNGAGFDMQYHEKLFGVFQRLHSDGKFEGTGVGLAIVQRIINRHGGRVWAEGEVDKGATFYFTLSTPQE